jgi:hypothetical protein
MSPESSVYFDSIISKRSVEAYEQDEEKFLDQTVSLETQNDLIEEHISMYIKENFLDFLKILRSISIEDQELLLSYYMISKPQWCLAKVHRSTQTICSFKIRMAVKKLGAIIIFGTEPCLKKMSAVLESNNLESIHKTVKTSILIDDYRKYRNFSIVAKKNNIHRPDVRRILSQVSKILLAKEDELSLSLGAMVYGLIDKASANGQGFSKRKLDKMSFLYKEDPEILGSFCIDVEDKAFEHVMVSRANH